MSDKFLELYNQFMDYVDNGDETGARKFLLDHFKEFPEEVQDKLTLAFFEEAVSKEADNIQGIIEIQEKGLELVNQIEKVKKILEDKKKEADLRAKLTQ